VGFRAAASAALVALLLSIPAPSAARAPEPFPLSLELRALGAPAIGRQTTYAAVVRNTSGHHLDSATVRFRVYTASFWHRQSVPGYVNPDQRLRDGSATHSYAKVLSGLDPGATRRIVVRLRPAMIPRADVIFVIAAANPGSRASTLSLSTRQLLFVAFPSEVKGPMRPTIELRGPATVWMGSRARYTVIVRNATRKTIPWTEIAFNQDDPSTDKPLAVTTDWPGVPAWNHQVAVVRRLRPAGSVTFHVTSPVPPPARLPNGKLMTIHTFQVRLGRPGQVLGVELSSRFLR
jgi:hypothetical protein